MLEVREPSLNETDWGLIVELLEREQKELLVEVRHAHNRSFREQLRARLSLVERLLGIVGGFAGGARE